MTRFVTAVVILVFPGECGRINKPMIKGADVIMLKKTDVGLSLAVGGRRRARRLGVIIDGTKFRWTRDEAAAA